MWIGAFVLAVALSLVFWRVAGFEFLNYDDDLYLTVNPVVQNGLSPDAVSWALTTFHEGIYQPVTWLSYLTDISIFGMNPGALHLVNLILHLFVSLMLWRVLARATQDGRAAFVVALLFALHPLQVQSVAWIAGRNGLLAALFGLIAIDQWIKWLREGDKRAAAFAHLAFAVSLLAKPLWLPLPFLLLLLDRWPMQRPVQWREKRWMFLVALAGTVLAAFAQASTNALSTLSEVGVGPRLVNAVLAWAATLRRLVAPFDLAAFYPFRFDHPLWLAVVWGVLLVAGSLLAWRLRERRPAWFTGWFWWLILQAPTVGLLQFGAQQTADRFSYLPLIGLLIMLVYAVPWSRRMAMPLVVVAVLGCGVQSWRVLSPWHDTIVLFEHSLSRSGGSALEHQNLCRGYLDAGDLRMAMRHSSRAVHYAPYSPTALIQQADLLFALGSYVDAQERYREALKFDEGRHWAWAQVGQLYSMSREWELAARAWYLALQGDPDQVDYLLGLAVALHGQGLEQEELALYQRALTIAPDRPGLRSKIAWIHATSLIAELRDPVVALRLAEIDLRLSDGQDARALEAMAAARAALGELDLARSLASDAEELARQRGDHAIADKIRERREIYLPEGR